MNATANLKADDQVSFTSIVALYDVLLALFRVHPKRSKMKDLRFNRPEQAELDQYQILAKSYFESMASHFRDVGRYMSARTPARVARKMRGSFGGHILFRPIGLVMFARLASRVLRRVDMDAAMSELALLPVSLSDPPYADVIWSIRQRRMTTDNAPLVARLLTFMLGAKADRAKLKRDYAKVLDRPIGKTLLPVPVSEILSPKRS